jgi:hypothetical protein
MKKTSVIDYTQKMTTWGIALGLIILSMILCTYFLSYEDNSEGVLSSSFAHYALRIGIVIFSLAAWFLSQLMIKKRITRGEKIGDTLHDLSAKYHLYLHNNAKLTNALLIIASALIDLIGIWFIASAILGASVKPFVALVFLFCLRQLFQALCVLPPPPGMIWHHPGVPSLLITYKVSNDFFFSGHTAITALAAIELYQIHPWYGIIAGMITLFESVLVIILRAHYTMDVLTAIFAAICSSAFAQWFCSSLGI